MTQRKNDLHHYEQHCHLQLFEQEGKLGDVNYVQDKPNGLPAIVSKLDKQKCRSSQRQTYPEELMLSRKKTKT